MFRLAVALLGPMDRAGSVAVHAAGLVGVTGPVLISFGGVCSRMRMPTWHPQLPI